MQPVAQASNFYSKNVSLAVDSLNGGRTVHSVFKLPLDLINIETSCFIIVWHDCSMTHKGEFEELDSMLKDIIFFLS